MKPLPPAKRSNQKSIVYITMHKAGSTVHDRILQTFVDRLGLVRIQMEEDQKKTPLTPFDYIKLHTHQFKERGYYFGPYRGNYFGPHRVPYSNRL